MTSADLKAQLARGCALLDVRLPPGAEDRLLEFVSLLVKWNAAYNLTAVRDPDQMVTKHLLDSLSVVPFLHGQRSADVGCGAGLPGIPLALACPDRHFVLLDSNGKKTRFVTQAAATLGLHNIDVVQARAEDYRPTELFATVTSRAFASLADFLEQTAHLCAPTGRWLAMKGAPPDEELRNLPAGFRLIAVHPLKVPGLDAKRCLVEVAKL